MTTHLGCRPTVEEICALHPEFGNLIRVLDNRFKEESQKLELVKKDYKAVTTLNATSKADTKLKTSDSRYLRRSTRVAEDTMEIVEASMSRLQRIVDCLAKDFTRVDHGMIVSTQVEHLEYLDDLTSKCDLLKKRVAEQRDRVNLLLCADDDRLSRLLEEKISSDERDLLSFTASTLGSTSA